MQTVMENSQFVAQTEVVVGDDLFPSPPISDLELSVIAEHQRVGAAAAPAPEPGTQVNAAATNVEDSTVKLTLESETPARLEEVTQTRSGFYFTGLFDEFLDTPKVKFVTKYCCTPPIYCLLFAITLLTLMISIWPSLNLATSAPVCQSSECHSISAKILGSLNTTYEPCENFLDFACGGWTQANPIPKALGTWDPDLEAQRKMKVKLHFLLATTHFERDKNAVEIKVKQFYDSCMNSVAIESDEDKPLKEMLKHLGGWDALKTLDEQGFDFQRVLKRLHANYRVNPYFRVQVIPDPEQPGENIIQLSPSGLTLPRQSLYRMRENQEVMAEFKSHVQDAIQLLGAPRDIASVEAAKIVGYEGRIAEITPEEIEFDLLSDFSDDLDFTKMTLKELKAVSGSVFWLELVSWIFPKGNISEETIVLVTSQKYLKDISEIILTSDRTVRNNYLMWRLVHKYIPYLSKDYFNLHENLHRSWTGWAGSMEATGRWEFCMDETIKIFLPVLQLMIVENRVDLSTKIENVRRIFDTIQKSFAERIAGLYELDSQSRNLAMTKILQMQIKIGAGDRDRKSITEIYKPLVIQLNNFFENIRQANDFLLKLEQDDFVTTLPKSKKPRAISFFPIDSIGTDPFKIEYRASGNEIIFPEFRLESNDLLLGRQQQSILYGSVGVVLGEVFARALGIAYWPGVGNKMIERLDNTRNLMRESCLARNDTELNEESFEEINLVDMTYKIAGIEIALNALEIHATKSSSNLQLGFSSLESYNSQAIIFLSYAQSQCSASRIKNIRYKEQVIQKNIFAQTLQDMTSFKNAFSCSHTRSSSSSDRSNHLKCPT